MTNELETHPAMRGLIQALQREGFASSLEYDDDDDYVTLTIQRKNRYY